MTVVLKGAFADDWRNADVFAKVRAIDGNVVRQREGRRTLSFEYGGELYYLKHHRGVGWGEIAKCYSQLKKPVVSARNEFEAINRLHELGLHSLEWVAFGERGLNPASRESFLITKNLDNNISLEDYVAAWADSPPSFAHKRWLIEQVALITRTMHEAGINHRDLYICHFLKRGDTIHLMDLHRAQMRAQVPTRWLVKDLASLYFSVFDARLNRRDILRFMRNYFSQPLREIFLKHRELLQKIKQRALGLYRRDFQRAPNSALLFSDV